MLQGCKMSNGNSRICVACSPLEQRKCKAVYDRNQAIIAKRIRQRGDISKEQQAAEDNAKILAHKRLAGSGAPQVEANNQEVFV